MHDTPQCPECGAPSYLSDGREVYGTTRYGSLYVCQNYPACDCYVGCHRGTTNPLGSLANKETRESRKAAHAAFDPLWRRQIAFRRRTAAYRWLAEELGLDIDDTHIGLFSVEQCERVIELCSRKAPAF